ncbi:predicted protein [Sclerotinia sclerotiorum 1980 UF-70]|uniref:Uncharacterized protein n=1 Tax=Sclerotinia sclerotiorum (strain ATCC 18683 / 1980 / Ss-1) TaxID=665079 RepID=A7EXD5_SCLS1|nr:predicted protein [Sclerotinia sclerotiorum 1980 UF-70]EDN94127.1 predicted protein [Sclerotinia sclerotiorum 1980 UF-70]
MKIYKIFGGFLGFEGECSWRLDGWGREGSGGMVVGWWWLEREVEGSGEDEEKKEREDEEWDEAGERFGERNRMRMRTKWGRGDLFIYGKEFELRKEGREEKGRKEKKRGREEEMASIQLPQLPMPCHHSVRLDGFNLRFEGIGNFEESVCEQPRPISSPMTMQFLATQSSFVVNHTSDGKMEREVSGRKMEDDGVEQNEGGGAEKEKVEEVEIHMRGGGTICDLCVGICAGLCVFECLDCCCCCL